MKIIGIGLIAVAAALAGCTMETQTVEQSTSPAAGEPPLSYPAQNMAEFDTAMNTADEYCYEQRDLMRARYVDRTWETARFECVER